MPHQGVHAVVGAFGFTGRYITYRLLRKGKRVRALIVHDRPNPFGDRVEVHRLVFHDFSGLVQSLRGVDVLYNTYWVRFPYKDMTFERALMNTQNLFEAAREAKVRRVVHISIINPSPDSPLPYFRFKALAEQILRAPRLSYAILRPTVLFGEGDILLNNIAYFLRRFPLFLIPDRGDYKLQPVFVGDVANFAVEAGEQTEDVVVDTVGPEVFTFFDLVATIRDAIGSRAKLLCVPSPIAMVGIRFLGYLVRDIVLTRDELKGLMANLLVSREPLTCPTRFTEWLYDHADRIGRSYASELARHFRHRR